VKFVNSEPAVSLADIVEVEQRLSLQLPAVLQALYLKSNGGFPHPYVFEDENIDTVVSEFLPIRSANEGTAVAAYANLVLEKGIVGRSFFPFAVDGGGDYFFVDCSTAEGAVYFYRGDSASADRFVDLRINLDNFWSLLKEE
jgi:hypothetical protein